MPPKRKRHSDRPSIDASGNRPSPHRPEHTFLGRHDVSYPDGGGGGGRGGRGGRQTRSGRSDRRDSTQNSSNHNSGAPAASPTSPTSTRPPSASSHAAPAPIITAPISAPPSAPPSPTFPNYDYSIVTEERIGSWKTGGRQAVIDHGVQSRNDEDATEVSALFQELLHSALDSRIDPVDAGGIVKEVVQTDTEATASQFAFDPRILFLDTVSIFMDVETIQFRDPLCDFMLATEIPHALMRQVLDPQFMTQLGLIRETFVKVGIRQSTNLLYRQANYNLLREESEGFSKLVNELYTSLRADPDADYPWDAAQATFERVKGLIGTFDLDVGRVFDISLDVFAATIVKQLRPFLKFLRISSWWPRTMSKSDDTAIFSGLPRWAWPELAADGLTESDHEAAFEKKKLSRDIAFWRRVRDINIDAFYELGAREVAGADLQRLIESDEDSGYSEAEREWIKTTKTLPARGNRTAAQILGFKLRFYQTPENEGTKVPGNLLWVAAVLIKIGFISLTDIYPHVYHPDEEMKEYQEELEKELRKQRAKNRPGAASNALAAAGALSDDTLPPGAANQSSRRLGESTASKPDSDRNGKDAKNKGSQEDDDIFDQKCLLLEHLLLIGALPEALFIIGRFPWLVELAGPKVLPGLHRILEYAIDKVYAEAAPVPASGDNVQACPPKKIIDLDQTGVRKGDVRLTDPTPRRFLRWPHPDKMDHLEGQNYRYYFNEWNDNIPVCQDIEDVLTLCNTLLNISGVHIGLHAPLLAKLTAIGTHSLHIDKSPENYERWRALLQRLLVPALSHTGENSYLVDAVWAMLKLYPTHVRYSIYADWYEGPTSRLPGMRDAFEITRLNTQGTMKRLSADNIKKMARTMAKAAYSSPGIVFKVALEQIEAYSNLIEAFIECAKYFTDLGYDVLLWSLLNSLSTSRSRTSSASVLNTSQWLQALSKFSGQVFRRYANLNPTPVLLYVNEQLCKGNSTDLVILERLITSMGGVVSDVDFTDAQLEAMTGGPILRKQTLINVQDKRFESSTQKSALRLMRALLSNDLAGRLLVSIAQYRQVAIYRIPEDEAHIKYLASVIDSTQKILSQFLDLLRSNLEPDRFDATVPGLVALLSEFGLDPSLAFMIGRGSLTFIRNPPKAPALPSPKDELSQAQVVSTPAADAEGDVPMTTAVEGSPDVTMGEPTATAQKDSSAAQNSQTDGAGPAADGVRNGDQFLELLQPLSAAVQPLLSPEVLKSMSPEFYTIFWSLQLSDIAVPQSSYEAENTRLRSQLEETIRDRSDMSKAGQQKKAERRTGLENISKQLRDEMVQLAESNLRIRIRVAKGKPSWFPADANPNAVHDTLIEQCLLPRLLLTATDSIYTFRAVKFLHENRVPNFKLMTLYDRLFNANRLRTMIFTCTMGEAVHFGRFLRFVLADLASWHRSKALYEEKGLGLFAKTGKRIYLGFATAIDDKGVPQSFVEHDPFRDLLYSWHKNLNTALKSCLQGSEWMHIRNAISVLSSIVEVFPAVDFMGSQFAQQLDAIKVREKDRHADLATAAGMVESSMKRRKPKWVMVQAFRPNISGEPQEEAKVASESQQDAPKSLRPSAPEFRPKSANGTNASSGARKMDVEDGEVKDGRVSSNKSTQSTPIPSQSQEKKTALANDKDTAQKSPAPSTLPAGNIAGLPKRPELPKRPDVPMPGQGLSRNSHNSRGDSRESRDGRGNREPRDARETREPRESRDTRDARDSRETRDARNTDSTRSERSARDFAGSERRGSDNNNTGSREAGRPSDKDRGSRNDQSSRRIESVSERDSRPSRDSARDSARDLPRDNLKDLPRDRNTGPRSHDGGRPGPRDAPRDSSSAPRGSALPPAAGDPQEPTINPARARLLAEEHPGMFTPDRAVPHRERRGPSPTRSPRDDSRQRSQPARPPSPPRGEQFRIETVSSDRERNQGRGRGFHVEPTGPPGRESYGGEAPIHNAPRDKYRDRDGERSAGDRQRHSHDQDNGRLSHHDPNYGRLNPIQSVASEGPSGPHSGPPSGPRGRGARESSRLSSLDTSVSQAPSWSEGRGANANGDIQRGTSPDRQPPTGPASGRGSSRRNRPGQFEPGSAAASPTSTVAPSPTTGVHPDRMRLVSGTGAPGSGPGQGGPPMHNSSGPNSAGPVSANSIPVNPSRLSQMNSRPAPSQQPASAGPRQPMGPPLHTPDRPSHTGRGPLPPSNIPSHTPGSDPRGNHSVPSGPGSANDRNRNRGPRAMMDSINTTLEKAGQENRANYNDGNRGNYNNNRMSGGRNVPGSDARILTGGSPASTPTQERTNPMLRDLPGDRGHSSSFGGDMPRGGPVTDYSNHGPNGSSSRDGRDHERSSSRKEHRESRSGRPSRRGSRDRSGDRGDRGDRESREHRESGRDRRSGAPGSSGTSGGSGHGRDGERESSSRRGTARDSTGGGGREAIPNATSGRESLGGSGRESRHRGDVPRDHSSGGGGGGERMPGGGGSRGGRGGGGSGMPQPRSSDDRRDGGSSGGRDDRGSRKRRSEDAAGLSSDRDKRQRR
ncbi:THO complex subunit 2 [Pyricularia oryzae]|uniref:THO complex subunit 2 n=2 Tax=Pyricularia oryzae TaxID=318829 RepID=A0AA97NW78_PYRO3|nr:THO complex subunit 2 [Pyricularia oryzae Y34]KAI7932734.1 THO complex subunit 2 [Pyricularia oryzae]